MVVLAWVDLVERFNFCLLLKWIVPQFLSITQISYMYWSNEMWYCSFWWWWWGWGVSINPPTLWLEVCPQGPLMAPQHGTLNGSAVIGPWMVAQGPRMAPQLCCHLRVLPLPFEVPLRRHSSCHLRYLRTKSRTTIFKFKRFIAYSDKMSIAIQIMGFER